MAAVICDLPPEMLSAIFEAGKDMTDEMASTSSDEAMPFEVLVSHICSLFRRISFATPTLWTSIRVHGDSDLDHIVQRLERSRSCGLNIQIELADEDPEVDETILEVITEHIFPHSFRWRSLFIRYSQERQDDPITTGLFSVAVPNLECLSITVEEVDEAPDSTIVNRPIHLPHIFTAGAPKLAFVRLRGLAMQFFRPPLNNVVTLHLDQVRYLPIKCSTFREILSCSPFLTNLSIYGSILRPGSWPNQSNPVYLPTVRSLRIFSERGETYSGIMDGINAPILESLTLKSLQEHDLDSLWNVADQSLRFRTLKTLTFTGFSLSSHTYKRIFQTFRCITSLSILGVGLKAVPFVKALSEGVVKDVNGTPFIPWPDLETLRFGADIFEIDPDTMSAMLEARRKCGFPISTFVILVPLDIEDNLLPLGPCEWQSIEINICPVALAWPEDFIRLIYDSDDTLFW